MTEITKYIRYTYYLLFALLPLSFLTITSELFEFNKMIVVYAATAIILGLFVSELGLRKNFALKKSPIYIALGVFIASMTLSTLISIDFRTSLLGYYSRFHGGLSSYICYSILSFIYINFFDKKSTLQSIKVLVLSTVVASLYAFVEHFGYSISCLFVTNSISANCWVQDVQNRVFGTFGQPNWLAAWLVAIYPLSSYLSIQSIKDSKKLQLVFYTLTNYIILTTLYFTKSRSAALALLFAFLSFWIINFYYNKSEKYFKKSLYIFSANFVFLILITLFINTPWQPKVESVNAQEYEAPALEVGGTESGDIRKVVWQGAFDLFKKYPLLGTGLDTFAYSYFETRPYEHNMLSEWNFVYNRAHNEYLNFLATTGMLGTFSYIFMIFVFLYIFAKENSFISLTLGISTITILITNFFGFSTVGVGTLMFIFPAMAIASNYSEEKQTKTDFSKLKNDQKLYIGVGFTISLILLILTTRYWTADLYYAKGIKNRKSQNYEIAKEQLTAAIGLNNKESVYHMELSEVYVYLGDILNAASEAELAIRYSPHDLAIHKKASRVYGRLATADQSYLQNEYKILEKMLLIAPSDPSTHYMYANFLARVGEVDKAIEKLIEVVEMKPDFKLARTLLAYIYEDTEQYEKAKEQYELILKFDPNDEKIKEDLQGVVEKI